MRSFLTVSTVMFLFSLQVRMNVVNLAAPHLQDLYNWLEIDFDPLNLCSRVQSVIDIINNDEHSQLQQYVAALKDVTLVRLIRQVHPRLRMLC